MHAVPNVHAVGTGQRSAVGQCQWTYHFEDVDLRCTERAIPGGAYCADHLIEHHAPKGPMNR